MTFWHLYHQAAIPVFYIYKVTLAIMTVWSSTKSLTASSHANHYSLMPWQRFPYCWPIVRGNHRSTADSSHRLSPKQNVDIFVINLNNLFNKPWSYRGMRLNYTHVTHFNDIFLWHLSLFELNLAVSWIILVMDSAKERRFHSVTSSLLGWAQYPELSLSIIPHDALGAGFATLSWVLLYPTNITHGLLCFNYFSYHLWICGTHSSIFDKVVPLALGWSYVWSNSKRVFPNDMINDFQVYSV